MRRNGKSRALICFVLCMIMALPVYFSSTVTVKAAEQQTIIVGTNAEYSPFEYLDDDGNITGFDEHFIPWNGKRITADVSFFLKRVDHNQQDRKNIGNRYYA